MLDLKNLIIHYTYVRQRIDGSFETPFVNSLADSIVQFFLRTIRDHSDETTEEKSLPHLEKI